MFDIFEFLNVLHVSNLLKIFLNCFLRIENCVRCKTINGRLKGPSRGPLMCLTCVSGSNEINHSMQIINAIHAIHAIHAKVARDWEWTVSWALLCSFVCLCCVLCLCVFVLCVCVVCCVNKRCERLHIGLCPIPLPFACQCAL